MRVAPKAVRNSLSSLSARFSVAHRLLRKVGFDHVTHAENIADRCFKIFFVCNSKRTARLGIIIGKKTLSGAADRNRVKRVIREAFRQHSIKQRELDLVVMVKRNCPIEGRAQTDDLKMLFSRIESRCVES